MKKIALSSLVAGLALAAAPAWSAVEYYEVQVAPPAPIVEVAPAPQSGMVWIPGYYDYRGSDYVWVQGHFEPARTGYVYSAPRYVEKEHRYYSGRWVARNDEEEHGGLRNKLHAKKDRLHEKITGRKDDD
jgi:YXWGXW repeat-containing protein